MGKTFRAASWYVRAFAAASCSTTNGLAAAALDGRNGPRTMIVWPHHSWVSEILRMGRTPGFSNDTRGVAAHRIVRLSVGGLSVMDLPDDLNRLGTVPVHLAPPVP